MAHDRSCGPLGGLTGKDAVSGVWVRLHYVYPYPHVDAVIPLMAAGKVLQISVTRSDQHDLWAEIA